MLLCEDDGSNVLESTFPFERPANTLGASGKKLENEHENRTDYTQLIQTLLGIKLREQFTSITKTYISPKQKQVCAWALRDGSDAWVLKQICDILVIVPKAKKKEEQYITMSFHDVQYSNKNCHYMMAGGFTSLFKV